MSPFFYYLVAEKPLYEHVTPCEVKHIPSQRHLLSIDANTGKIVQDIELGEWNDCAIEDADRRGILLSFEDTQLTYFHAW